MAGIEPRHRPVARDAHQAVGREQEARLEQGDAKRRGKHGQQQVEHRVAGECQAQRQGSTA